MNQLIMIDRSKVCVHGVLLSLHRVWVCMIIVILYPTTFLKWNVIMQNHTVKPEINLSRPRNVEVLFEDHIWMYIGGREANSKPKLMPTPNQPLELSCVYSTLTLA